MRKNYLILIVCLIISGIFGIAAIIVESQTKKLDTTDIIGVFKSRSGKKTIAEKNVILIEGVRKRGFSDPLDETTERLLRTAGANDELINVIRRNSPPVKVIPTPTPITVFVTPTPTPAPRPRVSASPDDTFKNSIGMEFASIPAGSFMMGSPGNEAERSDDEKQHKVTINNSFYMGKYEVTQAEWQTIMGSNPSSFKNCPKCPVESVSWEDVQVFIKKLNAKGEGTYRLPTEAEWEYAARAGTTTAFSFGNSLSAEQANFDGNYPYGGAAKGKYLEKTTAVGSYQPNNFGLYDMHGNVWEWCEDWFGEYPSGSVSDPKGPSSGSNRVNRGGSWFSYGRFLRSAIRFINSPSFRFNDLGFRLVRSY